MVEKEVKNTKIEIRLTPTEKECIRNYAKRHGMSMSEAVLSFCSCIFSKKEEN